MAQALSANDGSTTRSGISGGAIHFTGAGGNANANANGNNAPALAGLDRNVTTGADSSGKIANNLNQGEIEATFAITAAFIQQAAPLAAYTVGTIGQENVDAAKAEADHYQKLAKAEADPALAAQYTARADEASATADKWGDNGIYRVGLHTATQAAIGGLAGGNAQALTSGAGVIGGNLGQQLGKTLGEAEADKLDLKDDARVTFINGFQQTFAAVGGALAGVTAGAVGGNAGNGGGALVSAVQGGGTGNTVDANNRQLHPDETKWIKDNAKKFADQNDINQEDAIKRLAQQASQDVDLVWRGVLPDGTDEATKAFLAKSNGTFINSQGQQQALFTVRDGQFTAAQYGMFDADKTFINRYVTPAANRNALTGVGTEIGQMATGAYKTVTNDPLAVGGQLLVGLWQTAKDTASDIPGALTDFKNGFVANAQNVGEGIAASTDSTIQNQLNALYGQDVSRAVQIATTVQGVAAVAGAVGAGKAAAKVVDVAGGVLEKGLARVAEDRAVSNAYKSSRCGSDSERQVREQLLR